MERTGNKSRTTTSSFNKKFIRRSNSRSEKSIDNKKHPPQMSASITFIKTPKIGDIKLKTEPSDFFKVLASSISLTTSKKLENSQHNIESKQPKSTMKKQPNYIQVQTLEEEL